jgi:ubiquinone biosynthesis protein COQ9
MLDPTDPPDPPQAHPDETLRQEILAQLLPEAAFDGFTEATLERAARAAGLDQADLKNGLLRRLFPRGVADALRFWSEEEDRRMAEAFRDLNPKPQGLTKKITWLIRNRIEALDWNREAARRAAATLALPHNGTLGASLIWQTADAMWRAAEDKSTDFNWYTKRFSLSAIYGSTLSRWFADQGDAAGAEPYEATWAFLDDRIGDLMRFEKAKAQAMKAAPNPEAIAGFLGKLRYPGGGPRGGRP